MSDSGLPQRLDELSSEWLTETLRAAGVIERARVTRHSCELLGGSGAGLIGTVARLRLERFLSTVANFVGVDWGDEQGAVRRDRSLARRIARLGRLRLSDLPG